MEVLTTQTKKKIKTQQLKAGMLLSNDVQDRSGRTLLRAGATLEEKHLKIFLTWGVTEVEVATANLECDDSIALNEPVEIPAYLLEQSREIADRCFIHTDLDHPAMRELYGLTVNRIATGKLRGLGHDNNP